MNDHCSGHDKPDHYLCNLSSMNVNVIQGVTWPDKTEALDLRNNEIKSMDGVSFNDNLRKVLILDGNKGIKSFQNTHFPIDLETLFLTNMDLSYQAMASIDWRSLNKLQYLDITRNQAEFEESVGMIQFPESLEVLGIEWSLLKSMMESNGLMRLPIVRKVIVRKDEALTARERRLVEINFTNFALKIETIA